MKTISLYTDGGSRNNPGPAAIGGVAFDEKGSEVFRFKKFLGTKTNNQAEYLALLEGLAEAKKIGVRHVNCFLDSELVVRQLSGLYKIKHQELKPLAAQIKSSLKNFDFYTFTAVPRDKNKIADKLVNEALDENV